MYIHFFYIESKEYKINYISVIKHDNLNLDNNIINKFIYRNIYLNNNDDDNINYNNINYISLFYIKKGLVVENKQDLWNQLIKLYMENIKLINLIDNNYIKKIQQSNILLFNIDTYKDNLSNFIINNCYE
jgi:hypothetical protein